MIIKTVFFYLNFFFSLKRQIDWGDIGASANYSAIDDKTAEMTVNAIIPVESAFLFFFFLYSC